jgi:2-polyprenyl-3-methyl-5-hydroxy-6-metoxy-1,4-benzoquinol methylase
LWAGIQQGTTVAMKEDGTKQEDSVKAFVVSLEERLASRSDRLEEVHLEAAIDAQVADDGDDDNVNPNAIDNCWSPYVPSKAERIAAFLSFAELTPPDVLLDIGCGDGRVCIAAAVASSCRRSIGVDVSPPCIAMAKQVAEEEGYSSQCAFYQADMTIDPAVILLDGE